MDKIIKLDIPQGYEYIGIDLADGKLLLKKKSIEYPKTYDECCKILNIRWEKNYAQGYRCGLISKFQELLIARDVYWKIAGEEMGLGKPWEPDWTTSGQCRYTIETNYNKFIFSKTQYGHRVLLVFPTEEMRDAFYDNFKSLIELCKDLL